MVRWTEDRLWEAVAAWRWIPPSATTVKTDEYELAVTPGSYALTYVYGFQVDDVPRADQRLRDLKARIEALGGIGARFQVTPTSRPPDLAERLERHGYRILEEAEVLAWRLYDVDGHLSLPEFPDPTGIVIREVLSDSDYDAFTALGTTIFGDPPPPPESRESFLSEFRRNLEHEGLSNLFLAMDGELPIGRAGTGMGGPVARFWGTGVLAQYPATGGVRGPRPISLPNCRIPGRRSRPGDGTRRDLRTNPQASRLRIHGSDSGLRGPLVVSALAGSDVAASSREGGKPIPRRLPSARGHVVRSPRPRFWLSNSVTGGTCPACHNRAFISPRCCSSSSIMWTSSSRSTMGFRARHLLGRANLRSRSPGRRESITPVTRPLMARISRRASPRVNRWPSGYQSGVDPRAQIPSNHTQYASRTCGKMSTSDGDEAPRSKYRARGGSFQITVRYFALVRAL